MDAPDALDLLGLADELVAHLRVGHFAAQDEVPRSTLMLIVPFGTFGSRKRIDSARSRSVTSSVGATRLPPWVSASILPSAVLVTTRSARSASCGRVADRCRALVRQLRSPCLAALRIGEVGDGRARRAGDDPDPERSEPARPGWLAGDASPSPIARLL